MPTSDEHEVKIGLNTRFLSAVDRQAHPDWWATAVFYTAVHYVEKLAAKNHSSHHDSHSRRAAFVSKYHNQIDRDLMILNDASRLARYASIDRFRQAFSGDNLDDLEKVYLDAIVKYVEDQI
jgi:hypothetical protein